MKQGEDPSFVSFPGFLNSVTEVACEKCEENMALVLHLALGLPLSAWVALGDLSGPQFSHLPMGLISGPTSWSMKETQHVMTAQPSAKYSDSHFGC